MADRSAEKKISLEEKLPTYSPHVERFRARQLLFDRDVEFRLLPEGASEELGQIFLLELEDLLNLEHDAFLPVYDHGKTRDRPFYVVPLRSPETLWKQSRTEGVLDLEARCRVVRSLADAYAAAHRAGILLGPPSPLALSWDAEAGQIRFTHHRLPQEVRRLPYPEHAPRDELAPGKWSTRSDLFHWAYFSYWLISAGKLPYQGKGAAMPIRCVVENLGRELSHALDGCLVRDAALRPENALELVGALEKASENVRPEEEVDLELSGTIPHETLGDTIENLRKKGVLPPLPENPERVELEFTSGDVEIGGISLDSRTRQGLGILLGIVLAVGLVGGVLLGGAKKVLRALGLGGVTAPIRRAATPTRPAVPEVPVHELDRSAREGIKKDQGVTRLLRVRTVHPARFPSILRRVRKLANSDKLPGELAEAARLDGIEAAFKADRPRGCRKLEEYLEDLRYALGEG